MYIFRKPFLKILFVKVQLKLQRTDHGYIPWREMWNKLSQEVTCLIYVSTVSKLCMHSVILVESAYIENFLRSEERVRKRLNSIVSARDIDGFSLAADRLQA